MQAFITTTKAFEPLMDEHLRDTLIQIQCNYCNALSAITSYNFLRILNFAHIVIIIGLFLGIIFKEVGGHFTSFI